MPRGSNEVTSKGLQKDLLREHLALQAAKAHQAAKDKEIFKLRERLEALQGELAAERDEKEHMKGIASKLRNKVETVRAVCGDLERQQQQYDKFVTAEREHLAHRRPEKLAPSGPLQFCTMEGEFKERKPGGCGRSSKRTAYCTDYGGVRYLGVREADAKEQQSQRIASIMSNRSASAMEGSVAEDNSHGPRAHSSLSVQSGSVPRKEVLGLSSIGYAGIDSKINLEEFRKRSNSRTRQYKDYQGKLIRMDQADWPTTAGVFL